MIFKNLTQEQADALDYQPRTIVDNGDNTFNVLTHKDHDAAQKKKIEDANLELDLGDEKPKGRNR